MKSITRLYKFLEFKGIKPAKFEKESGLSQGYLSKMNSRNADIGESALKTIIEYCPEMNPIWLVTGQGQMLKKDNLTDTQDIPTEIINPLNDYEMSTVMNKFFDALERRDKALQRRDEENVRQGQRIDRLIEILEKNLKVDAAENLSEKKRSIG